jgi:hypothetical protein
MIRIPEFTRTLRSAAVKSVDALANRRLDNSCVFLGRTLNVSKVSLFGQTLFKWPVTRSLSTSNQGLPQLQNQRQVYGVPTKLFKFFLNEDTIRSSFLRTFIPGLPIVGSQRLDEHIKSALDLQLVRNFLHNPRTEKFVSTLLDPSNSYSMAKPAAGTKETLENDVLATNFIREWLSNYENLKASLPQVLYNASADFVCELENKRGYVLVAIQVLPQQVWDRRALFYAAALFVNQMKRGSSWGNLHRVIGVNILGQVQHQSSVKHVDNQFWMDAPDEFMRHYKFQDTVNKTHRVLEGEVELIQYCMTNAPADLGSVEMQDWFQFLNHAPYLSEEDVKRLIQTPAVLQAFEMCRLDKIPKEIRDQYNAEEYFYQKFPDLLDEIFNP